MSLKTRRARESYEAMLEEPRFTKKLAYLGTYLMIWITYVVLGLLILFVRDDIMEAFPIFSHLPVRLAVTITGTMMAMAGIGMIWLRYLRVVDYIEFCRRTIRDLYIRDVPILILDRVNTVLRSEIGRSGLSTADSNIF